jgi:plastocyanin
MATTHLVEIVHDEDVEDGQARYEPDPVTITAGDSIVWVNRAHMEHTASRPEEPGRFESGFLLPGDSSPPQQINDVSDEAGFAYGCAIHPGMVGTVIVRPRTPDTTSEPESDTVSDTDSNLTTTPA